MLDNGLGILSTIYNHLFANDLFSRLHLIEFQHHCNEPKLWRSFVAGVTKDILQPTG